MTNKTKRIILYILQNVIFPAAMAIIGILAYRFFTGR